LAKSKYEKYILTELKMDGDPEEAAKYAEYGIDILWMDSINTPGAFQMNCAWYFKSLDQGPPAHTHDCGEILGFFSGDPKNPHDLGGEVEFWMEDEKFIITKSAMIFIPAGVKHCPLILRRVDRPLFHFSVVTSGQYKAIQ
jgi:hypothetical protein